MVLEMMECEANGSYLLQDLVRYPSVHKLTKAILDGKSAFRPLDFSVWHSGQNYTFLNFGQPVDNMDVKLKELLSKQDCPIPGDYLHIKSDPFERELYVAVGYQPEVK